MKTRLILAAIAATALMTAAVPVQAQTCPCDCYFSSDCSGGMFCNWGNLSVEDTCFWRTPKPQGSPGANCDEDFDNWGQCDGICSPSNGPSPFRDESIRDLVEGLQLWGDAFTEAALAGGGPVDADLVDRIYSIPFYNPNMANDLGRVVVEVMMLSRGVDFFGSPQHDGYLSIDFQTNALSEDDCAVQAGNLALEALIAEVRQAGSGAGLVDLIPASCFDEGTLASVCQGADRNDCLYDVLARIGESMGEVEGGVAGGGSDCSELGVQCADVLIFQSRCLNAQGLLQVRVILESTAHDGDVVQFWVDGEFLDAVVDGDRAWVSLPGYQDSGEHLVGLADPHPCQGAVGHPVCE